MTGEPREYVLEGFAVPEELSHVSDLLERAGAEHPEVDATDLMLFETAVVEIANNVVEHGEPRGGVRWRLTLRVSDEEIVADLVDSGAAFTVDLDAAMPGVDAESGRGLALAEAVLDVVELRRAGAANHWHLVRRLRHDGPL